MCRGFVYFSVLNNPIMRATEMVLIEAETAYMSGDEPTAKARLT